jgi:hypothetical protein
MGAPSNDPRLDRLRRAEAVSHPTPSSVPAGRSPGTSPGRNARARTAPQGAANGWHGPPVIPSDRSHRPDALPSPTHRSPDLPRVVRSGTPAPPAGPGSVLDLAATWSREPVTVLVHGASRDLVNLVTYGLVAWVGSEFSWIDVRIGHQPPSGMGPVHLGLIPAGRLVVVSRLDEMAPNRIGGDAVRAVIRSDGARDSFEELSEFVRLPRPIQLALARTAPGPRPGIMVVSNAHRLIALYDAATVPELLREVTALGASIFVSFADEPPTRRTAFDYVLRVVGQTAEEWSNATIEFERAVGPGAPPEGLRIPIADIAPLCLCLSDAIAHRTSDSAPE